MARLGLNLWVFDSAVHVLSTTKLITKSSSRGADHRGDWSPGWGWNGVSGISLKLGHYGLIGHYDSWSVLPGSTHKCSSPTLSYFHCLVPPRRVTADQMDESCSLTLMTKPKSSPGREVVLRVAHKCLSATAENSRKKSWDPGLGVKGSWTLLTKHIN